ncbi:hypothetical protein [Embleya sp. NBC_00896]|uniref:hypothetical protein n=1 Tax=Embleya sp. NBC_00896 TaxID=2975961 RepID=UPI0038649EE3|nr:hypothetical protein OG928_01410 [Embleya sp. NBC_00896]
MSTPTDIRDPRVELDGHRIEFTPYPGDHGGVGFVPTRATCSCGTWASNRPWAGSDHLKAFGRHLAHIQTVARIVPPAYAHLAIAPLRCVGPEHAEAVVRDWPRERGAEHGLFHRDDMVFIAYRDNEFPCSVAVWAHLHGHATDVYAGRLLRDVT